MQGTAEARPQNEHTLSILHLVTACQRLLLKYILSSCTQKCTPTSSLNLALAQEQGGQLTT